MADNVMPIDPGKLERGDLLCYRPSDAFGWIIAVKTWHTISHVENYFGQGARREPWTIGSRAGGGVDFYPLHLNRLCRVLRPQGEFDMPKAMQWFNQSARGQGYDYLGLLCFTLAVRQGSRDKMWCSEFSTRWFRAGEFEPFSPEEDADRVAPSTFMASPRFEVVWSDKKSV